MEAECPPKSINQWYERAISLDRNCRESKREEEDQKEIRIEVERRAEEKWRLQKEWER